MTSAWVPDFGEVKRGPLYWRIASALGRDISAGRLGFGEQLPTHRALADRLGVTVNTVTKAYAKAERDGLVVSRTGRGTFVKGFPEETVNGAAGPQDLIDLTRNGATSEPFNSVFGRFLGALSRRGSLYGLFEHHPHPGLDHHRLAGARWIARRGIDAKPEQVVVCSGVQEALLAIFSAITRPGDTVITEKLTYAGFRGIAKALHFKIHGVEIDEHGLIPDALEAACRQKRVAAILVNATNHNPTNAVAPLERRKAVVEIARRAGVLLVEDDIFGHLSGHDAPTLAALAPDRCIHVCGLSKCIAMALRVGYIITPSALMPRILDSLNTLHWSSPALMGEIATMLIEGGRADEIVAWHRREARARQRLACEALGLERGTALPSYHLWVPLPEPWRTADFVRDVRQQGVLVAPADHFVVDGSPAPRAVRLALGLVRNRALLQRSMRIIAENLRRGGTPLATPAKAQRLA